MILARPLVFLIVLLFLPATGLEPSTGASRDPGEGAAGDEITALVARVEALETQVAAQNRELEEAHERLERLEKLGRALAAGCVALDDAARHAREHGLEMGVVNPQARTDLLEGLHALAGRVREASLPARPGAPPATP